MSVYDHQTPLTPGPVYPETGEPTTSSAVVLEPPADERQSLAEDAASEEIGAAGEDDFDDEPPPQERFEELAAISDGIESATSLGELKPLYFQLVDFANLYKRNVHLEPLITQIQLRLVARGNLMKHASNALPAPEPPPYRLAAEPEREPPPTEDLCVIAGEPPPEPAFDAPQADEVLALVPVAPQTEFGLPERPLANAHKHRIKVQPLKRNPPPARKRVVRTLVGIGMGLSMVAGIMVILRNQKEPVVPTGPAVSAAEPAPALPALVQLVTDVPHGEILIDGQAAGGLVEGEWTLGRLSPGEHTLILRTEGCQTQFQFRIVSGGPPVWQKPPEAAGCKAVAISSAGKRGSLVSTEAGLVVQLDGQTLGVAGPRALQVATLFPGEHVLDLGPRATERRIHLTTREEPSLHFYVEISGTTGTMVAAIEEDGAELLLNRRRTGRVSRGGRLRIPLLKPGDYLVTAVKPGFSAPAEQLVTVRRGQEAHVELRLAPAERAPSRAASLR
jgi:hypothetical protein